MSKFKGADFYYGAVLASLFNRHINPVIVESGSERQVYDLTTNNGKYRLFIKYRTDSQAIKKEGYSSWVFCLTKKDISEIMEYIKGENKLIVVLVCGIANLTGSEIALLNKEEIIQIIDQNKTSITVSRKKGERAFRIGMGGGRDNSLQIKANRFETDIN